jgi:hypothetical protein
VVSNGELFGRKFNVYAAEMIRPGLFSRDPKNQEVWHICGQVVAVDATSVTLNYGGSIKKINFEQGDELDVTVHTQDAHLVVEGSAVELEGNTRAGRFLTNRVAVTLDKPLTADDLAGPADRKEAKTKSAPGAKSRKPGKEHSDEPDKAPRAKENDPFGVLGGKDGKGSDGGKPKSGSKQTGGSSDSE